MSALFIPSPAISGITLGSLRFRFYPLLLIVAIAVTWLLSHRRWRERGGEPGQLELVVMWTAPLALLGGRAWYVLANSSDFFGEGGEPWTALYVWQGGNSFFGALLGGLVAVAMVGKLAGVRFSSLVDVLAPAVAFGYAIGRLGNWFSSEMFGIPSQEAWALEIEASRRPEGFGDFATFHPVFLFEALAVLLLGFLLLWLESALQLGRGKVFALFLALYGLIRFGAEFLRIDPAISFGFRVDLLLAALTCVIGIAIYMWLTLARPGREATIWLAAQPGEGPSLEDQVRANLEAFNRFRPKYMYGDAEESAEKDSDPDSSTRVSRRPRRQAPAAGRRRVPAGRRAGTGTAKTVEIPARGYRASGTPRFEVRVYRPDPALRQRAARRRAARS